MRKGIGHRLYVVLVVLLAAVTIVFINLSADTLENKFDWHSDFSRSSVFTLSNDTRALLDGLTQDVLLYAVYENDAGDTTVEQLLKAYDRYSPRVYCEVLDPVDDVAKLLSFARDAASVKSGSIVVSNAAKDNFTVLDYYDFYLVGANGITGVQGEQSVTSAICHIVNDAAARRAIFMGANTDAGISNVPAFATHMSASGYDLYQTEDAFSEQFAKSLNKNNDLVIFLSPNSDINSAEADALIEYIMGGGSVIALMDNIRSVDASQGISLTYERYDNFARVFETAGVSLNHDLILMPESDANLGSITRFAADATPNGVFGGGASGVIMSECSSLSILNASLAGPLLTCPENAYLKTIEKGMTLDKTPDDASEARCVAACGSIGEGKVAVLGSSSVAGGYFVNEANRRFLLGLMRALLNDGENPIVMSVSTASGGLKINTFTQQALLIALVAGVIPLSVMAVGVIVLYRRKKRSGRAKSD